MLTLARMRTAISRHISLQSWLVDAAEIIANPDHLLASQSVESQQ